jgi:hypothetical protein
MHFLFWICVSLQSAPYILLGTLSWFQLLRVTQTFKKANFTINILTVLFSYLINVDLFTTRTKLSGVLKANFETHELLIIVVHGKYFGLISNFFKINHYFDF